MQSKPSNGSKPRTEDLSGTSPSSNESSASQGEEEGGGGWWPDLDLDLPTAMGGVKAATGLGEMFVGGLGIVAPELSTSMGGAFLMAHGWDLATTGLQQMRSGTPTPTRFVSSLEQSALYAGASPQTARYFAYSADLTLSVGAEARLAARAISSSRAALGPTRRRRTQNARPNQRSTSPNSNKGSTKEAETGRRVSKNTGRNSDDALEWKSWSQYERVEVGDSEYAIIGDRLYTRHAVERMQPRDFGPNLWRGDRGRSISPNLVDYVIRKGEVTNTTLTDSGKIRKVHELGSVKVTTENRGQVVISTNPWGSK